MFVPCLRVLKCYKYNIYKKYIVRILNNTKNQIVLSCSQITSLLSLGLNKYCVQFPPVFVYLVWALVWRNRCEYQIFTVNSGDLFMYYTLLPNLWFSYSDCVKLSWLPLETRIFPDATMLILTANYLVPSTNCWLSKQWERLVTTRWLSNGLAHLA